MALLEKRKRDQDRYEAAVFHVVSDGGNLTVPAMMSQLYSGVVSAFPYLFPVLPGYWHG